MDPYGATIVSNTANPFTRYSSYKNGNSADDNYDANDFNEQLASFKASAAAYAAAANRKRPAVNYPSYNMSSSGPAYSQPWSASDVDSWNAVEPAANWAGQSSSSCWNQTIPGADWSQATVGNQGAAWPGQQKHTRGYAGLDASDSGYADMTSWNNPGYSSFEKGAQPAKRRTIFPTDEIEELSALLDNEPPIPESATYDVFSPYYGIETLRQGGPEAPEEEPVEQTDETGTIGGLSVEPQPGVNVTEKVDGAQNELFDDLNSFMRDAAMIAGVKPEADVPVSDETLKLVQEIEITVPSELMSADLCQLCMASFSGPDTAQSHYEGKRHAQKENQYIRKIYEEKGINVTRFLNKPAPQKKKSSAVVTEKRDKGKLSRFRYACNVCSMCFETRPQVDLHITHVGHRRKVFDEQTELFNLQNTFLADNRTRNNWSKRGRNDGNWAGGYEQGEFYTDGDYNVGYSGNYRASRGGPGNYRGGRGMGGKRGATAWGAVSTRGGRPQVAPKAAQPVGEYFCSLCDKVMNAPAQYEAHLLSKKHKAKQERIQAEEY